MQLYHLEISYMGSYLPEEVNLDEFKCSANKVLLVSAIFYIKYNNFISSVTIGMQRI